MLVRSGQFHAVLKLIAQGEDYRKVENLPVQVFLQFIGFEITGWLNADTGIQSGTDAVIDCTVQSKSPYPRLIRPRNNIVSIQVEGFCFPLNGLSQHGNVDPKAFGKIETELVTQIKAYSGCPSGFGVGRVVRRSRTHVSISRIFSQMSVRHTDDNAGFLCKASYSCQQEKH